MWDNIQFWFAHELAKLLFGLTIAAVLIGAVLILWIGSVVVSGIKRLFRRK